MNKPKVVNKKTAKKKKVEKQKCPSCGARNVEIRPHILTGEDSCYYCFMDDVDEDDMPGCRN